MGSDLPLAMLRHRDSSSNNYLRAIYERFKHEITEYRANTPAPTYSQLSPNQRGKLDLYTEAILDNKACIAQLSDSTSMPQPHIRKILPALIHAYPPRYIATMTFDAFLEYIHTLHPHIKSYPRHLPPPPTHVFTIENNPSDSTVITRRISIL